MKYQDIFNKEVIVDAIKLTGPIRLRDTGSEGVAGDYLVQFPDCMQHLSHASYFEQYYKPLNAVEVPIVTSGLARLEHARDVAKELRDLLREIAL